MSNDESAAFEHGEESYLQTPSPKRVRFDHPNGEQMQVSQVVETFQTEDPNEVGTVTITVPSSQFEIEINSQVEEDESEEIQRSDLTGPAFGIVRDPQVCLNEQKNKNKPHTQWHASLPGGSNYEVTHT